MVSPKFTGFVKFIEFLIYNFLLLIVGRELKDFSDLTLLFTDKEFKIESWGDEMTCLRVGLV